MTLPLRANVTRSTCTLRVWLATAALTIGPAAAALDGDLYSLDHWNRVLESHVDDRGLVDYAGLAADREALDRYLAGVRSVSPDSHPELFPTRDEQLSYYINAYNAWVFHGVLELPPGADTVWGKSKTGYGFFVRQKIVLGGEQTNLRKLENEIVRGRFEDPRIHAALNCASLSCPRLPRRAFDPQTLDEQLDAAMTEFVDDPRHCEVDPDGSTVTLSKIFDWFREDFDSYEASRGSRGKEALLRYVNRYRAADRQVPLDARIRFRPYDKGLNRQPE